MGLWLYGTGITGVEFYSVPVEEYIFMAVAPFMTIVFWEAFHKFLKKRK